MKINYIMKGKIMTEFVNFQVLETTTEEQLLSTADALINGFMTKQDGYLDAELVKNDADNAWCFIYHFESPDKAKALGENMRKSQEFKAFIACVDPGSIAVTFYRQLRKWN